LERETMSASVRRGKIELFVNGFQRRCYGVTTQSGLGGLQATISVDPREGYINEGNAIEVNIGYIEGTNLAFTGQVISDDTTLDPWWQEIRCGGQLKKINTRINKEDPTASATPTTGILPVLVDEGP
jgi:hypothetical protein